MSPPHLSHPGLSVAGVMLRPVSPNLGAALRVAPGMERRVTPDADGHIRCPGWTGLKKQSTQGWGWGPTRLHLYLMHLVQPSTPMAARAAGGLRVAGRSWAAGAGPGRLIGSRWPGGRLGRADWGQEGRWRPGREARLCPCHRCALAFWPGARPTPSLIRRRGHAPEAPPPTLPPERGEAAAAAPSPAPGGRDARPFPPRSHTSGCQTWCSQDPGAWAQSARRGTRPWAAGALGFP